MFNNNNVLRLVSLVIAVCLWVYVMGEVNPETKLKVGDINVGFVNTEVLQSQGLAVAETEPISLTATIKGKRSDVYDIKKQGLTAYIDVADCDEGKNTVNVQVNVPDGIRLENLSKETAEITVEKLVTDTKEVKIAFSEVAQENELIPWATYYEPEEIIVSGAASSVAAIDHIKGVIDAHVVKEESKNVEAVLTPVDKDGGIIAGINMSYEIVYADVQLLNKKEVGVNIDVINLEPGVEVDDVVTEEQVVIVGNEDILKGINNLEAELDMTGITKDQTVNMNIMLPEGVYLYNTDVQAVKVVLKK